MTKANWEGYIAIGRLGIPIRLYSAIHSSQPKFVQLHVQDNSPVQRTLECKAEQRSISFDEVIRGVEYEPGRYIPLTEHELEQVSPNPIKAITIRQFCGADAVEPQYYDKPYYVVPSRGGERGYSLIREVFSRSHKMALAEIVLRNKEHIAVLRVEGDLLMLILLRYAGEIVPRSTIKTPPLRKPTLEEIDALTAVVERFGGPLYMEDYHDERAEYIQELVERKSKGLAIRRQERIKPQATPENEIIPVLRNTLQERLMVSGSDR